MKIGQRIKNENNKQKAEEEEKRRKIEQLLSSHPSISKFQKLIPIVQPILRDLSNSANFIMIYQKGIGLRKK